MSSLGPDSSYQLENEWKDELHAADTSVVESLSISEGSDEHQDEDSHPGDYSTRMDELFSDNGDEVGNGHEKDGDSEEDEDEDAEEGFLYTGVDAPAYRDQLRDVLGLDLDEDTGNAEERSPIMDIYEIHEEDDPLNHAGDASSYSPSQFSADSMTPLSRVASPSMDSPLHYLKRPFPHPTVSRLRSYTPQTSRAPSNGSGIASHSHLFDGASPSPSHFSSISRTSSLSNLQSASLDGRKHVSDHEAENDVREVFKWTSLQHITDQIFAKRPSKASAVLGPPTLGRPTVLAANGFICIGTDAGKIFVYDFKQTLKCVCGTDPSEHSVGAVTALALSHDHTCVASGHATGYIQLFDLKSPSAPVRLVPPTKLGIVLSGRKEGHLLGSRIISIGFVAGRHTALVSADEYGLAFYHSLAKVLFVEASDILRILGRYPDEPPLPTKTMSSSSTMKGLLSAPKSPNRTRRSRYTVLAMAPLPFGTSPHATDLYNIIALLTPTKLVVVGLKPTPKTWFKCPREVDEGGSWRTKSKWRGTLAWFPSVFVSTDSRTETVISIGERKSQPPKGTPTTPSLVYTWGNVLHLIRVTESKIKQPIHNSKPRKINEEHNGIVTYEHIVKWSADDDIQAVQWLNANQIVVVTATQLGVYDVHLQKLIDRIPFDGASLMSSGPDTSDQWEVAHSVRVYKGKIFLLGQDNVQVGTLLTWADRILSFVQGGDFLSAIDLARSYYLGTAPGNRNGLPDDPDMLKEVIERKMRDLMVASSRYAFSEDRMTDGTHITPDGRGVDRTSLFEGLVTISCRACVAMNDFDFLFEDLFQQYDDSGISSIYLRQLEPFVLQNDIRYVPPRITQRLVALHEEDGRPDYVERVIWHIDPACLDINQAIHLCQKHHLYDALIYVYTRALRDYVAPIVELLNLIRDVQRHRKSRGDSQIDSSIEPIILNAYKIYPYLANVLSGLTYPSEEPVPEDEALQAKMDVYDFLFFGRSSVWPPGEGGKLVLTSDEEGGIEPTYPYVRQLLRFDSESFLHSLDIAFEDSYLNDKTLSINRLVIVRILLEILSSGSLPSGDATFVNIFIARNVPKYIQFLEIAPSSLHSILIGLAEDPDPKTRDDRQLAAEYLLSVYNPHESDRIIMLFQAAGFYRILRSWYRQEGQWTPLLQTYLDDSDVRSSDIVDKVDEVLTAAARANKGILPPRLILSITDVLPRLLQASISRTAFLVDRLMPDLHKQVLTAFGDAPEADHNRLVYLRNLLGPPQIDDDIYVPRQDIGSSPHLPKQIRLQYISLQCRYYPKEVITALTYLPTDMMDWPKVIEECESSEVYDAAVWAINHCGDPQGALRKAESFQKRLTLRIADALSSQSKSDGMSSAIRKDTESLQSIGRIGIAICLERSQGTSVTEFPLEDVWFELLSSQINGVQLISSYYTEDNEHTSTTLDTSRSRTDINQTLSDLRLLVQSTFSALVSVTSTRAVSFPRLFKRLVNSVPTSSGAHYNEFRVILAGMLESYRSDGDMLLMTKHLVDGDLFDTVAELSREQIRGWAPSGITCTICKKSFIHDLSSHMAAADGPTIQIVISRTGTISHKDCFPQ